MITKISTMLSQMRPAWMERADARSARRNSQVSQSGAQKMMGEPLPKVIDLESLPPELAALFAAYGMLDRIKRKLATLSRKRGNKIIPASGTIACVDADDNIYVGVEFLAENHEDEDLIAGILAHEWGHMMSEIAPGSDLSDMTWDQVFEIRRNEERKADAHAGRALYRMGYTPDSIIKFLVDLDKKKNLKSHKYDDVATRTEIIKKAFIAELKKTDLTNKLFDKDGYKNPESSILIAVA